MVSETPPGGTALHSGATADGKRACAAQSKSGAACKAFALPDREYCRVHDPASAAAVRASRAKGGAAASKLRSLNGKRARLDTPPQLLKFTATLIQDVVDGTLSHEVTRCALYGVSIQRQLLESTDVERRLKALEQANSDRQRAERSEGGTRPWAV